MRDNSNTKKCCTCGEIKPKSEFYKLKTGKDGHISHCRTCVCKQKREKYRTPEGREKMLASVKKFAATEAGKEVRRKAIKKYNKSEKGKIAAKKAVKNYRKTKKGREHIKRTRQKQKGKKPARQAVHLAVKKGELPRPDSQQCAKCDRQAKEYHHWSYKKEHYLDVVPLCIYCHRNVHKVV